MCHYHEEAILDNKNTIQQSEQKQSREGFGPVAREAYLAPGNYGSEEKWEAAAQAVATAATAQLRAEVVKLERECAQLLGERERLRGLAGGVETVRPAPPNADALRAEAAEAVKQDNKNTIHKKRVPLGPEDVLPGSVIRGTETPDQDWAQVVCTNKEGISLTTCHPLWNSFEEIMLWGWQINRSIPLTGKWDANAWEPCSKEERVS